MPRTGTPGQAALLAIGSSGGHVAVTLHARCPCCRLGVPNGEYLCTLHTRELCGPLVTQGAKAGRATSLLPVPRPPLVCRLALDPDRPGTRLLACLVRTATGQGGSSRAL